MGIDMSTVSSNDRNAAQEIMHRAWITTGDFRSCLGCDHWRQNGDQKGPEECTLYNMRPPADVIVFGCAEWFPDIPF